MILCEHWWVVPNGKAPVSKTGGSNPLEVQVLYPPPRIEMMIKVEDSKKDPYE